MRSDCTTARDRLRFLFFFGQRRLKVLFRRHPRSEITCNALDDLISVEGLDKALYDSRVEEARSRLGWGITHI
jgi:hypothetical protein